MKLAIYDFDGTLFTGETLPYVLKFWKKNNYSKLTFIKSYIRIVTLYLIYKSKINPKLNKERFRAKASLDFLKIFKGMSKEEISHFFTLCASSMKDHFNKNVLDYMEKHHNEGFHIVICSGAYDLLLEAIKEELPIDTIIGTKIPFTADNTIDYSQSLFVTSGKNKKSSLLESFTYSSVDFTESYSFGDSYFDYDILTLTGHPIAVKPDEKLKVIAVENKWEILD